MASCLLVVDSCSSAASSSFSSLVTVVANSLIVVILTHSNVDTASLDRLLGGLATLHQQLLIHTHLNAYSSRDSCCCSHYGGVKVKTD